jgi:1,4-dihydroxy-6-naphthoate synthase
MRFSRGLDRGRADTFVGMYVNEWTLDYGDRGRAAVRALLDRGVRQGLIEKPVSVEFIDD